MTCQVFPPIADVLWTGMVYAARAGGSRAPAPERRSRPLRPVGALQPRSPGACVLHLSGAEGLQGRGVAQFRDGCHAFGGEHAAALQLPVLVLLQQHRSHQAGDGGIVGKDAHNPGAAFYLLVDPLQQVGAPDLAPVVLGEVAEGQHVLPGLVHQRSGLGEALGQRGGEIIPA